MSEDKTTKLDNKLKDVIDNNDSDTDLTIRKVKTDVGDEVQIVGDASLIPDLMANRPQATEYKFTLVKEFEGEVTEEGWEATNIPNNYKKTLVVPVKKMPVGIASQVSSLIMPLVAIAFNLQGDNQIGKSIKINAEFISEFLGQYGGVLRRLASIATGYDEEVFLDWYMFDLDGGDGGFNFFLDCVSTQPNLLTKVNL